MDDELLDDDGRPIVFYYSRGKRLERTRMLRSPPRTPQGLNPFRTLTATKPLTFLFITIALFCISLLIFSRFLSAGNTRTLEGNRISLLVNGSNGVLYIGVQKTALGGGAYTGPVDIAVFQGETLSPRKVLPRPAQRGIFRRGDPVDSRRESALPAERRRISFTPEAEENFGFSIPFTGEKLFVLMEAGTARVLFSLNPGS